MAAAKSERVIGMIELLYPLPGLSHLRIIGYGLLGQTQQESSVFYRCLFFSLERFLLWPVPVRVFAFRTYSGLFLLVSRKPLVSTTLTTVAPKLYFHV